MNRIDRLIAILIHLQSQNIVRAEEIANRFEISIGKSIYGSISQMDLGERIRAEFMMDNLATMARWLFLYGTHVEVEQPEELESLMEEMVGELHTHYSKQHEF